MTTSFSLPFMTSRALTSSPISSFFFRNDCRRVTVRSPDAIDSEKSTDVFKALVILAVSVSPRIRLITKAKMTAARITTKTESRSSSTSTLPSNGPGFLFLNHYLYDGFDLMDGFSEPAGLLGYLSVNPATCMNRLSYSSRLP